jgi:hypothetical protein
MLHKREEIAREWQDKYVSSLKEKLKNSAAPPLYGEVSKTCKKNVCTKTDNHISGTKADTSTNLARRPTNQRSRHEGHH